jgi:hypothetical protein
MPPLEENTAGSFSWRIRRTPPRGQRFQLLGDEMEDQPTWILNVLLASFKNKNLKVLGFRVPEKRFFVKLTLNLLNKLVTGWRPHFWKLAPPRDRSSSKRKKLRKLKLL